MRGRARRKTKAARLTSSVPDLESVHKCVETLDILRAASESQRPERERESADSTHQVVSRLIEQEDLRDDQMSDVYSREVTQVWRT